MAGTAWESGRLHHVSLILGRIINALFTRAVTGEEWDALMGAAVAWYEELPMIERPCARTEGAKGELPSVWFIEDSHGKFRISVVRSYILTMTASAMHYFLIACCILAVFASPAQLPLLPIARDSGEAQGKSRGDILESYATEICAIAFTARTPSVLVNAFGPIAYSESDEPSVSGGENELLTS